MNKPADAWGFARYAHENIDWIVAFGGALAVRKRFKQRPIEAEAAALERLLPNAPDINTARHHYAVYLMRHYAHLDRAYELLKQVREALPDDVPTLERLFHLTTWSRRLDEALSYAQRVAALRPAAAPSWRMLSEACRNLNRKEAELDALQRLLQLEPDSRPPGFGPPCCGEEIGDRKGALADARKVVELAPQEPQALK